MSRSRSRAYGSKTSYFPALVSLFSPQYFTLRRFLLTPREHRSRSRRGATRRAFPKIFYFPEAALYASEEARAELNSLLWETCAPARIANGVGSSSRCDSFFSSALLRLLSPRSLLPQGPPTRRCTTGKTPLHARERRREKDEKKEKKAASYDTSRRVTE